MTNRRMRRWLLGTAPLAVLAVVLFGVSQSGVVDFLRRGVPPVEELTVERVVLRPGSIRMDVVNGGPDPVTVAQVIVDEAFWEFTIAPDPTVERLGRATILIPYPWVKDEAHHIAILSSTGVTFEHEIAVAEVTPVPGRTYFAVFTLIGLYVGVIPVAIGLLWYPALRGLDRRWLNFFLALTVGLLVFLGLDAVHEALEAAAALAGAFQGTMLVVVGALGALGALHMVAGARAARPDAEGRAAVAWLIALGIGLHNLGEGLAIGAAYALGEAALGAFLIIGFMLHNTTEGLGIVAPIAQDRPRIGRLVALGALAGVPTILGAWIGGLAYSPFYATLFLAVGAGAIAQVVFALWRVMGEGQGRLTPVTAGGVVAGLLIMYSTGLLVAV
jgi:zinc transporter ZupT